jgi:hypothetical protein
MYCKYDKRFCQKQVKLSKMGIRKEKEGVLSQEGDLKYKIAALFYNRSDEEKSIIIEKFQRTGRSLSSFYRYMKIKKTEARSMPLDVAEAFADIFNMLSKDLINK